MNSAQMVEVISDVAFNDSHVVIDKKNMIIALEGDLQNNGNRPLTEDEITLFICGDDDGKVPEELEKLYPLTNDEIASYWR